MGIIDSIRALSDEKKRKMQKLYNVMSKCEIWHRYSCCKNMDGKTCVSFRDCPTLKAYDKLFVKLTKQGEALPYLPGKIDYSGLDRHYLMGGRPKIRQ